MGKRERGRRKEEEKKRRKVRAAGLLHDTANVVGIMPAMSRPPLHKKRPCSNRLGKTQKMCEKKEKCKFEQSAHWFVTTNRPKWHLHRPRRPKVLTTILKNEQNATKHHHHCLQLRENATNHSNNDKLMSKIRKNTSKTLQETTIKCPKLTKTGS